MVPPLALQDPAGRGSRGQHEDKPTDTPRGRLPTATFPVQAAERGPGESSSAASGETQGRGKDGAASSAGEQAGVGAAPKSDPPPAPGDVDMEKSVTPRASPRRGCSWSLQSTEELRFAALHEATVPTQLLLPFPGPLGCAHTPPATHPTIQPRAFPKQSRLLFFSHNTAALRKGVFSPLHFYFYTRTRSPLPRSLFNFRVRGKQVPVLP